MNDAAELASSTPDTPMVRFLGPAESLPGNIGRGFALAPYNPQRQYDYVRLIVTVGLLALFGFVIVWVAFKSSAPDEVWKRTKDMLQIVLPALTALIGSVLGFYFGSQKYHSTDQ